MNRKKTNHQFNFVYWDSKGWSHDWIAKYEHRNFPPRDLCKDGGAWSVGPGFIVGQEENYRQMSKGRAFWLNKVRDHYKTLDKVPDDVKKAQFNQWMKLTDQELEARARELLTKVALLKRERANGLSEDQIAKKFGIKVP